MNEVEKKPALGESPYFSQYQTLHRWSNLLNRSKLYRVNYKDFMKYRRIPGHEHNNIWSELSSGMYSDNWIQWYSLILHFLRILNPKRIWWWGVCICHCFDMDIFRVVKLMHNTCHIQKRFQLQIYIHRFAWALDR